MVDHALIMALTHEYGGLLFCGGHESGDLATALAFVRFVRSLPPTRIHPDDIAENCAEDFETKPRWSAEALEYVFSDRSEKGHATLVVDFFATLTAAQRARAWSSVRTQVSPGNLREEERKILAALDERIG